MDNQPKHTVKELQAIMENPAPVVRKRILESAVAHIEALQAECDKLRAHVVELLTKINTENNG